MLSFMRNQARSLSHRKRNLLFFFPVDYRHLARPTLSLASHAICIGKFPLFGLRAMSPIQTLQTCARARSHCTAIHFHWNFHLICIEEKKSKKINKVWCEIKSECVFYSAKVCCFPTKVSENSSQSSQHRVGIDSKCGSPSPHPTTAKNIIISLVCSLFEHLPSVTVEYTHEPKDEREEKWNTRRKRKKKKVFLDFLSLRVRVQIFLRKYYISSVRCEERQSLW